MAWGDDGVAELAAKIADGGTHAAELRVEQVAPRYRVPGSAYLKIREGREVAVEAALAAMDEKLHTMLKVADAAVLHRAWGDWHAGLPARGGLLHVGHETERTYGGYGNILAAIQRLAPDLEDARWFVSERSEARWIDELRVVDGALRYRRVALAEDGDELALRREEMAADAELRAFMAWRLARGLDYGDREGAALRAEAERRTAIERAAALDPDGHEVLFQTGCLARMAEDHAGALGWFRRAAAIEDPRRAWRLTTMAATAVAAGDRGAALAWLEEASDGRPDQGTWLLRGFLRGDPEDAEMSTLALPGDRESLPWSLHAAEIFEWFAGCASSGILPAERARAMFGWAELYRVRSNHGLRPAASRPLADRLYTLAAAIDPLGGEVAHYQVVHRHGHEGRPAVAGFLEVLADFPEEPNSLFWAASGLGKQKEWSRAIGLLRRYERTSGEGRSYERGAARSMLVGYLHMDACARIYERGDRGPDPELLLDEAIALSGSDARWEGPWVAKGDLYEYRRDHAGALKLYDAALARNPRSAHAWSGKGSCLNNLGRPSEALTCFDKALAISKDYWHAHYAKACTLARSGGDPEEILALVRRAIMLEPTRRRQIVEDPDLAGLAIPPEWK